MENTYGNKQLLRNNCQVPIGLNETTNVDAPYKNLDPESFL
jgi:hypothetical protein